MEKDTFLKSLIEAAAKNGLDAECKAMLAENQVKVLNRKLKEIEVEKERTFQSMVDAIMIGRNQLEVYSKIEDGINKEIKNLEEKIGSVQKGA